MSVDYPADGMNIGDVVMFSDTTCRYARWFLGQLGVVTHCHDSGADGYSHCRVEWFTPVRYHGRMTAVSDFRQDKFKMTKQGE